MPRVNFHCHEAHSSDATGSVAEVAAAAARRGVRVLCITNHVERLSQDGTTWAFDPAEARARLDDCLAEIERCRARFPALEVRFGAELEYRTEWREGLEQLCRALPFDFLLGSVHVVEGLPISGGPGVDAAFAGRSEREVYEAYFDKVLEMVRWGGFDVVAHLDLVKRFGARHHGPFRPERYARAIAAIFRECVRRGIGIEVNASGLAAPCAEPMPGLPLLVAARQAGVPFLTLGTDGHAPEQVDRGLAEVERLARRAGFAEVGVFRARTRRMAAIGRRVRARPYGENAPPKAPPSARAMGAELVSPVTPARSESAPERRGRCTRETSETRVVVGVRLDGVARTRIATGLGFFDHMLESLARHALLDLEVEAQGDLQVDEHHLVEDVGLALGEALAVALAERRGIRRFGFVAPMDESLAEAAIDLSGRPCLVFRAGFRRERVGDLPTELVREFFRALADRLRATLHLRVRYGANDHHKIEALFKAFALALRAAFEADPRRGREAPSSKGTLTT